MPRSEAENQRLREQQKTNILDAAMRVFARSGPAASMAEIAEAAGVSQGLAYRYFASKDEIYQALVEQALRPRVPDSQQTRLAPGSPWERLETLISAVLQARREHPEFFQLLYHVLSEGNVPSELLAQAQERAQYFRDMLRSMIVQGQATGEIADGDPDQMAFVFMAYLDGLTRSSLYDVTMYKAHFPDPALILRIFMPGSEGLAEKNERKQEDNV